MLPLPQTTLLPFLAAKDMLLVMWLGWWVVGMVGGRCLGGSSLTGALIVQIDFMVVVVDRICCGFAARSRKKN